MIFKFAESADSGLVGRFLAIEDAFNERFADRSSEAYQVILSASAGEGTNLFVDEGNILASWRILDVLRQSWANSPGAHPLRRYGPGVEPLKI